MLNKIIIKVMTRILITILVTLNCQAYAQEKILLGEPKVDRRVELLSIVFRLAESPEYSKKTFQLYDDRVEQYFKEYKSHELIQFTKSMIKERGLAYDSPMWMAIHLDDNLNLLADVKDVWQRDPRWTKENVEKFVPLLQKFYKDTKLEQFFNDNVDLFTETVKRFTPYKQMDMNWYLNFYGKEPTETFSIIIGLGNGTDNYGPSLDYINGSRKVYAIMCIYRFDSENLPEFEISNALGIMIHEFCHSFVNYLTEKNKEAFKESGKKIFSVVKDKMTEQAYSDWGTVLNEALVRASVIKYLKDHDFEQWIIEVQSELFESVFEYMIKWEKENGFFWIEELVSELESYDKQRDKYPTLESYMPKLVESYKIWAEKF
jgi:hypothetical protein